MRLPVPGLLENGAIALANCEVVGEVAGEHVGELVVVVIDEHGPLVLIASRAKKRTAGQQ